MLGNHDALAALAAVVLDAGCSRSLNNRRMVVDYNHPDSAPPFTIHLLLLQHHRPLLPLPARILSHTPSLALTAPDYAIITLRSLLH